MKIADRITKEYRYGCSIDCGGTPLRVYERTLNSNDPWTSVEDYVASQTFVWYNESSDFNWLPGHWLSELDPPGEGSMYYQDAFGVHVSGDFNPLAPAHPLPEYMQGDEGLVFADCELVHPVFAFGLSSQQKGKTTPTKPQKKETPFSKCLTACRKLDDALRNACDNEHQKCLKSGKPADECDQQLSNCIVKAGEVSLGCFRRCHDIPNSPPAPKIQAPLNIKVDIPTGEYDKCYPNWKDRIKGLPEPPKPKK